MTHSDVTEWFEWDCVPEQFSHMISTKKSKAKPKASKKVKAKASAEPKATKAPKKSSTLTQRVDSLESKMDKILEILTAK